MNTGNIVNNRIYFYRRKLFFFFFRKTFELFSFLNKRFYAFICILCQTPPTHTYTGADSKAASYTLAMGLRQHSSHHIEKPAPDIGQPVV